MKVILTFVSPILIWSKYIASLFTASNLMHMNFLLIFCSKSYRIFSLKFTFGCCGPEMKVIIIMFIVWLPTHVVFGCVGGLCAKCIRFSSACTIG